MDIVRVSCASFIRIRRGRHFLLLPNLDRGTRGDEILTPVGGAMQVDAEKGGEIMRQLNLTPKSFDKPPTRVIDLRFRVERELLPKVCELYFKWDDDPMRELCEELGPDETGIFTDKELRQAGFRLTYVGVGGELAPTYRSGQAGEETCRLVSVYDLACNAAATKKLWTPGSPLVAVTAQEIKKGRTKTGVEIAPITKVLLSPKKAFTFLGLLASKEFWVVR